MTKECKAPDETANDILADKDIPYEVRMKYIIDAYRKDQKKWGKLAEYAKQLQAEVARLNKVISVNGLIDPGVGNVPRSAQVIKALREKIYELNGRIKELEKSEGIINDLQNKISTFPLRTYNSHSFKNIIRSQKKYIEQLQALLDENDIPYEPRLPASNLEIEGVDEVVDSALEYMKRYKTE